MNYKYIGFSKKVIESENNLFNSTFYLKKASDDIKSFGSNGFLTKLRNYWNEFTKNISKSGYMDQLNFTVKSLNKQKEKLQFWILAVDTVIITLNLEDLIRAS